MVSPNPSAGERKLVSIELRRPFRSMTLAGCQERLWIESAEDLDQLGDDSGPAGLVAGAQARAGVAVEVLVEKNVVSTVGIGLEFLGTSENGPPPALITHEDAPKSVHQLLAHFEQVHQPA